MQTLATIAGLPPDHLRALQIFYPYAFERTMSALQTGMRFAHYSTAEAAMKMLNSGQVWMRKSAAMNDFREIDYGQELLSKAYNGETGKKLKALLNGMFPSLSDEVESLINGWSPHFYSGTYLTCISEHDTNEDRLGRLSMWRAYGGVTGVAVIMKGTPFLTPTDALKAYTSPVAYFSQAQFESEFQRLYHGILQAKDFVASLGQTTVLGHVFEALRAAIICTKHPGFHEEREWRIVYNPAFDKSDRIIAEPEVIRGVPQMVQKIPLQDAPEEGLVGITIPDLVDRIIVGPTNFPLEIREALVTALETKGVADADAKVVVSDIPLRNS